MAAKAKPHWYADSPELRRDLDKVSTSIQDDAERRVIPMGTQRGHDRPGGGRSQESEAA